MNILHLLSNFHGLNTGVLKLHVVKLHVVKLHVVKLHVVKLHVLKLQRKSTHLINGQSIALANTILTPSPWQRSIPHIIQRERINIGRLLNSFRNRSSSTVARVGFDTN
jgi:hypothetical protein